MRSSAGQHYVALDHLRALAAFMVFTWHFTHGWAGAPTSYWGAALLPLLDEGHTGVALFMTLSGYLFAKLLDGKRINYVPFFWNRFLRLAPLLALVMVGHLIWTLASGGNWLRVGANIVFGIVRPTMPNGGWSITVEAHFYLLLPLLLYCTARWKLAPLIFVAGAMALRALIWAYEGEIQFLAYWTIVGRIDQFLLGILAFQYRRLIAGRWRLVLASAVAFLAYYSAFAANGGFHNHGQYPSPSPLWIIMPTVEGAAYACFIAFYDTKGVVTTKANWLLGKAGEYSYSIYLLHFYFAFEAGEFIHTHVMNLSNFYVATLWSLACFTLMVPVGWLSFRLIEAPFLRLRRPYLAERRQKHPVAPVAVGQSLAAAG